MIFNITPTIKYIGVDHLDIDLFESQYKVPNGISYNSYIIDDGPLAIVDTVDSRKCQEWLINLNTVLAGRTPQYLIIHHLEPDHASLIDTVIELFPNIKVVLSDKAVKMAQQFFPECKIADKALIMKDGDTLSIGSHNLTFVYAPMVHWPEVMVSYDSTEKVLFSADGFGKFGALNAPEPWAPEARRYYINICGKYGMQVQRLLATAAKLDIQTICPLHGPILKENLSYYINLYDIWSKYLPEEDGVLIAYASIHGNTAKVASIIADSLRAKGMSNIVLTDLCRQDMSQAIADAFRLSKMIVAAASYDASVFPPMYDFLHHLSLKAYQNRKVGIIENGTWGPTAARTMLSLLEGMKNITIVNPTVTIWSLFKESDRAKLDELADNIIK